MARDKLRILLSVRRRSVEQARSALGVCLKAEAELEHAIRLLDDADRRERETMASWQDARQFAQMASLRTEVARAKRHNLAALLAAAEARSMTARAEVTAARTAAEAVDQLIGERDTDAQARAASAEQHVLDDIARARHGARLRGAAF